MENLELERIELLKKAHEGRKRLISISEEDYIEAIYEVERVYGYARLIDISRILGVKPPTVANMIKRLEEKGLVTYMRYRGVKLTEKGRTIAERISETHELIRSLLIALGVDEDKANIEAELIEHFLSRETLDRLREFYEKCIKQQALANRG
ncbi:MAG: metal-dependent transcriptional regulator [Desulfurococcales archaeon]|nr:metal-dependent transcriptional regulator [Desulfurococcales archaeon]